MSKVDKFGMVVCGKIIAIEHGKRKSAVVEIA